MAGGTLGRTVLPLGRRGGSREAMEGDLREQLQGLEDEAGVRHTLYGHVDGMSLEPPAPRPDPLPGPPTPTPDPAPPAPTPDPTPLPPDPNPPTI